jgi:hypothetical protein
MESAMNKSIALFLAALCMIPLGVAKAGPAAGTEKTQSEIGQGVMCDTVQHVQRFITLRGTGEDPGAAIETVNLEANDDSACQFAFVLYTDETPVGQLAVGGWLFKFIQITVHAFGNGRTWIPVTPHVQYTVTVEKGQIA